MKNTPYVACIGSRETPPEILRWMETTGRQIAQAGYQIITGNAPGADQAWARGANEHDPSKVTLCLPWVGFESAAIKPKNVVVVLDPTSDRGRHCFNLAETIHEAWFRMTPGGQRCHARNVMIVEDAICVFGYVNGGGTRGAFKLADVLDVPAYDVRAKNVRETIFRLVENAKKVRR